MSWYDQECPRDPYDAYREGQRSRSWDRNPYEHGKYGEYECRRAYEEFQRGIDDRRREEIREEERQYEREEHAHQERRRLAEEEERQAYEAMQAEYERQQQEQQDSPQ